MHKNTSDNNSKKPNKKKARNLRKELKSASERIETDILLAEKIIEKHHPKHYAEFVKFNRQFIGKRRFYQNKIQSFQKAWDSIPNIMDTLSACQKEMSEINRNLFHQLNAFEENQMRTDRLKTATTQLDKFSNCAKDSEQIRKKYDDICQNFADTFIEVKNFIAEYDKTYATEIALLKEQATQNYALIATPLLGAVQKILNDMNFNMQTDIKRSKKNVAISEKMYRKHLESRSNPNFISSVEGLKTKVKVTIEKMTGIRDELAAKKSQEEHARQERENHVRMLQKKQLDELIAEIEAALPPYATEHENTIENAFTQHLTHEAEKAKAKYVQFNSAGAEKEKIEIFFQHFSTSFAAVENMSKTTINDMALCCYKARLQYFNALSTALSNVVDAFDRVSGIEHVDQRFKSLYQKYQETLCNILIQHNALKNAAVLPKLLLEIAIKDKNKVNAFLQNLISERVSRFEGNVRIDAQIFLNSPTYSIAQENLVLKASGFLQEIEHFCTATNNRTLQDPQPIKRLCYLFEMKRQLATLKAAIPTINTAEAHNTLSEKEPQRSAAPTFDALTAEHSTAFRQDGTPLVFLENLEKGNISFSALTAFVRALGGECRLTANNHVCYNLPNIWASAVTNTTLTLGLPHGQTPDTNENISDPNVRSTIKREFATAGLTANLITEAMNNSNQQVISHPS